jgi:diacylglycerol diphosphate phosphatase/phosphatidate phosphatase
MAFGFNAQRTRQLAPTYIVDWIILIVFLVGFFLLELITPFHRRFSVDNKEISFPYAVVETVNTWQLVMIAFVLPAVIIIVIAMFGTRSWYDGHQGVLGLALAFSITIGITQIFKMTVGRLRPDFLSRCIVPTGTVDPAYGLLEISKVCQQTDKYILNDGSKSFPSGHSSSSFAGMTFLALFLAGKLRLFDRKGHSHKLYIVLMPFAVASLVAISRVDDYRHHWQDVLVGALLGMLVSYFVYRQYYPSLTDKDSAKPYSPRHPKKHTEETGEEMDMTPVENNGQPAEYRLPDIAV